MKKLVSILLVGLLLIPSVIMADKYNGKKIALMPHFPKAPARIHIDFYLDENTGDFAIMSNYDIEDLNIKLERNGLTYIDTTVSLIANQSFLDTLSGYDEGTYILTLSTTSGITSLYEITITAD